MCVSRHHHPAHMGCYGNAESVSNYSVYTQVILFNAWEWEIEIHHPLKVPMMIYCSSVCLLLSVLLVAAEIMPSCSNVLTPLWVWRCCYVACCKTLWVRCTWMKTAACIRKHGLVVRVYQNSKAKDHKTIKSQLEDTKTVGRCLNFSFFVLKWYMFLCLHSHEMGSQQYNFML